MAIFGNGFEAIAKLIIAKNSATEKITMELDGESDESLAIRFRTQLALMNAIQNKLRDRGYDIILMQPSDRRPPFSAYNNPEVHSIRKTITKNI